MTVRHDAVSSPATSALASERERCLVPVLLGLTFVTGLIDAVSFLGLGHIFTANMTGNVVLLGFAAAGTTGLSLARSGFALVAFFSGAWLGGRVAVRIGERAWRELAVTALSVEAALLFAAAIAALGLGTDLTELPARLYPVIALTGIAMGIRNAVVRKLGVSDLTTTVLTLAITGLAAEFASHACPPQPRRRRVASVVVMFTGALAGAWLLRNRTAAAALAWGALVSGACLLSIHSGRKPASVPRE